MIDTHVYQISDRPGWSLAIGVPLGEQRPAIWLIKDGKAGTILGRFYGDQQALVTIAFLDDQVDAINRVIQFYANQHGDGEG